MKSKNNYQYRKRWKGNHLTGYRVIKEKRSFFKAKAGFNVFGKWKRTK